MGFSVSGSAALVFAALLIAFGMWHSATADSFERMTEAEQDRADDALAEGNTAIAIESTRDISGDVVVKATNTGATTLSLNDTDIFVDNDPQTDWQGDVEIDDRQRPTDLWLPGETINATFDQGSDGSRIKIVTEGGVSDTAEVTT